MVEAPLELQFANLLSRLKNEGFTHVTFNKDTEKNKDTVLLEMGYFATSPIDPDVIIMGKVSTVRVDKKSADDVLKMFNEICKEQGFEIRDGKELAKAIKTS
jgi:hypothetical protein